MSAEICKRRGPALPSALSSSTVRLLAKKGKGGFCISPLVDESETLPALPVDRWPPRLQQRNAGDALHSARI